MIIYGASSVGMVRNDNQDSYAFDVVSDNAAYAVVCDGMGGAKGGKTASSIAVNEFVSNIDNFSHVNAADGVRELLKNAVETANEKIFETSIKDRDLSGMGTTLVSAIIIDDTGYFVNVGDSRAYLIRNDVIKRISHDHSAVQELVDRGRLTESQARNHPNKNIITRALGVEPFIEFDFFVEKLEKDDIIILNTDGMTNYVDDLEIPFEVLNNSGLEGVPQKLIELANSRGGSDNSTVVLIKV